VPASAKYCISVPTNLSLDISCSRLLFCFLEVSFHQPFPRLFLFYPILNHFVVLCFISASNHVHLSRALTLTPLVLYLPRLKYFYSRIWIYSLSLWLSGSARDLLQSSGIQTPSGTLKKNGSSASSVSWCLPVSWMSPSVSRVSPVAPGRQTFI